MHACHSPAASSWAARSRFYGCDEAERHSRPRCRRCARRGHRGRFALLAGSSEPQALEVPPPDESVVIYPDGHDPDEQIACMFRLDCLMDQIEKAAGVPAPGPVPTVPPGPPVEVVPV